LHQIDAMQADRIRDGWASIMTKKRRYLLTAAILGALIAIALCVFAMLPAQPAQPGVTKANFDRIKVGMTRTEVEAILGVPNSLHSVDAAVIEGIEIKWFNATWEKGPAHVGVGLRNDIVTETRWFVPREPLLDKLRRWMRLAN
jgi:hypothetical protein